MNITINTKEIKILIQSLNEVSLDTFEEKEIRDYLLYILNKNKL